MLEKLTSMSSSSSSYKNAIRQLIARIQANSNDTDSIVCIKNDSSFTEIFFVQLESIKYNNRTISSKLSSEWFIL